MGLIISTRVSGCARGVLKPCSRCPASGSVITSLVAIATSDGGVLRGLLGRRRERMRLRRKSRLLVQWKGTACATPYAHLSLGAKRAALTYKGPCSSVISSPVTISSGERVVLPSRASPTKMLETRRVTLHRQAPKRSPRNK